MHFIYMYVNKNNGKVYIGQTRNTLQQRAQSNGSNYRECPKFYNAIKKYGWTSFVSCIITTAETQEEANEKERYYISKFQSNVDEFGYNISPGGGCEFMSDETRRKISQKAKERYTDKTKNPMYGRHHSEESKRKMRELKVGCLNPNYGTKWNETQRERCSNKGKKLNLTDERVAFLKENARAVGLSVGLKPVRCIEDERTFSSITAAAKEYGVSKATLNGQLKGRQKTCAGRHFEYISEYTD